VSAFAYPVKDTSGGVREVVLVHQDVTEGHHQQEELRASEERLRLALAAGRMNVWDWDLASDVVRCSDNAREFWGIEIGQASDFMRVIHPEDVPLVVQAANDALAKDGSDDVYGSEYRLVRADGRIRWMQSRGRIDRGSDGRPARIFGVTIDVTDLKEAEEQLRLEDRRKDEFLATLAHELRNPLAPIRTGLALMRMERDPDATERTRQMMERQLGHMVRLVDELLDLSRVTRGTVHLEKERADLLAILGTAIEASRPVLDEAGVQLTLRLPEAPVILDADRTRIAQVVSNILNNAAKFTEPGGRVELSAAVHGADVRVSVTDTGAGIPAGMLTQIFEMFVQVRDARVGGQPGLGIGLTLVRRLVDLHGGRVWAESPGPGGGSTFHVTLPLAPAVAASDTARSAPPAVGSPSSRRVLVVDDNLDAAEMLGMLLSLDGHDVRTASNGPEAIAVAQQFRPQVALLDIGLPGMSGYELAGRLRAAAGPAGLVLVAVTGWGQEEDRRRSRDAGFDDHLTKPVDPAAVLDIVART
jgi:two-component system CheB/CheR fusion protein